MSLNNEKNSKAEEQIYRILGPEGEYNVLKKQQFPPSLKKRLVNISFLWTLVILHVVSLLWLYWLDPRDLETKDVIVTIPETGITETIRISVNYPKFVAIGDEGFIDVTVYNYGIQSEATISGTIIIDFRASGNSNKLIFSGGQKSSQFVFTDLKPSASHTQRISFKYLEKPSKSLVTSNLIFTLKVLGESDKLLERPFLNREIGISPIPYLQNILFSGGVLGSVGVIAVGLFSDRFRQVINIT